MRMKLSDVHEQKSGATRKNMHIFSFLALTAALTAATPVSWKKPAIAAAAAAAASLPASSCAFTQRVQTRPGSPLHTSLFPDWSDVTTAHRRTHNHLGVSHPFDWEDPDFTVDGLQTVKFLAEETRQGSKLTLLARVAAKWRKYLALDVAVDREPRTLLHYYLQNRRMDQACIELGGWFTDLAREADEVDGATGLVRLALIEKLVFADLEAARAACTDPGPSLEAWLDLTDDQVIMTEMKAKFLLL